MRKLTRRGFNLILISGTILFCVFLIIWFSYESGDESSKPDQNGWILDSNITKEALIKEPDIEEKIVVEFLSVNYLEDKEYLMRVEVGGEQVGIVYFDENGEIRFDGDKKRFEDALFKAFDARRVK